MASSDSLKVVPPVTLRGEGDLVAGRYQLVRKVGSGGMGSVWLAQDLSLDAHCAIKLIDGEKANDEGIRMRFEREAKASAQLRSAHVVNVFDYGIWNQTQYLAMEYLDGEDLAVRLMRLGRLDYATTYRIIAHVSRALMSAHAIGIVHRDLKPENIFLVQNYDEEIAKVLDFGIAQHNAYTLEDRATREGAFLGTPCYVSPEQARGRPIDHRSDLWSLGVIVFQCLTGQLPFEGTALGELMGQILYEPLPEPTRLEPTLPKAVDEWWERAAARNREQRFQSAKEMADQLGAVLGIESIVLVPTVPPRRRTSFPPAVEHSGVITAAKMPLASVRTTAPAPELESDPIATLSSKGSDIAVAARVLARAAENQRRDYVPAPEDGASHGEVDLYIAMLAAEPLVSPAARSTDIAQKPLPAAASEPEQFAIAQHQQDALPEQELEARAVIAMLAAGPATHSSTHRAAQESSVRFVEPTVAEQAVFETPTAAGQRPIGRFLTLIVDHIRRPTLVAPLVAVAVVICAIVWLLVRTHSSTTVVTGNPLPQPSGQASINTRLSPAAGPSSSAETLTVDMLPLIKRKGPTIRQDANKPVELNEADDAKKADPSAKPGSKTPRTIHPARDYGI